MNTVISTVTTDATPASFSRETSAIEEINRLHAEAQQLAGESRNALDGALLAAWQAGKLLISEKARVRRHAGSGAWIPWLQTCFHGGVRTAQRYMQLARRARDLPSLRGLSLRQACFRLGIPISPKNNGCARGPARLQRLPAYTMLAVRLTRLLRSQKRPDNQVKKICFSPEMDALYAQLRELYETR